MSGGVERAALWTRLTDRTNAAVWRLPLSHRGRARISQVVYRNPPIPQAQVVETLSALEAAGVPTILIGGWGIDALLGRQLRPHRDLDILTDSGQLQRAVEVVRELGYERWHQNPYPGPIGELPVAAAEALRDGAMRVVELHGADLRTVKPAQGRVGERSVLCISAEHQLRAQSDIGKTWTWDLRQRRRMNLEAVETALERSASY